MAQANDTTVTSVTHNEATDTNGSRIIDIVTSFNGKKYFDNVMDDKTDDTTKDLLIANEKWFEILAKSLLKDRIVDLAVECGLDEDMELD